MLAKIRQGIKKSMSRSNVSNHVNDLEEERLKVMPRFTLAETSFMNKRIKIVDNASFFFIRGEIFQQQIYKFQCASKSPFIIDCGANIGLSTIYFKQLYPDAEIIAIEPDDIVFHTLSHNIKAFDLRNVHLIKKACWNEETTLKFYSEGADGGRVARTFDRNKITEVSTILLSRFLDRKVDFLKIDIEGAENVVLEESKDLLHNVERIFVEYHSFSGEEQKLPEILSVLKSAGFRLNIHHIGVYSPNPFVSIRESIGFDLQLNIFGYRA